MSALLRQLRIKPLLGLRQGMVGSSSMICCLQLELAWFTDCVPSLSLLSTVRVVPP